MIRLQTPGWLFKVVLGLAMLASNGMLLAQYHYYNVPSGADCILQDYRSPNVPGGIYDAIHEEYVTSSDGGAGYFYGGFTHQNEVNGSPHTLLQYVCWPASGGYAPYSQQIPTFAGTNMVWFAQIGEGSCCAIKGFWPQFKTNLWTREVVRYWLPSDGTKHVGFQGMWLKEPTSGNWYHVGTVLYPFAVTGVNGMSGWQENFSGHTGPYIVDHGPGYYHLGGRWHEANQISYTSAGYVTLIDGATATESEVAVPSLGNNVPKTLTMSHQPATPALDPIIVSEATALTFKSQLLVRWTLPESSSPQLSYRIEVFGNPSYSGSPLAVFSEIAPDTRQKPLNIPGVATPFVRLTITDIFDNISAPVLITPNPAVPGPATVTGATVPGLAYRYFESPSIDWNILPNFSTLTAVAEGAVNTPDVSPRRRRSNYGFAYSGYITVPTDGIYAFNLHSGDGSRLLIDGAKVIDFDGLHDSSQYRGGTAVLAAGAHTFELQYFKGAANPVNTGALTDGLGLSFEGPGMPNIDVPASAYSRIAAPTEPFVAMVLPVGDTTIPGGKTSLSATVEANGNTVERVEFFITEYSSYYVRPTQGADYYLGQVPKAPFALNTFIWSSPTNQVRARLVYHGGRTIDSAPVAFKSVNPSVAPWYWAPLEIHNYPSGASRQGNEVTLTGDGMNLISRKVTGNCTLIGRVAAITPGNSGPDGVTPGGSWRAGIILRGTTNTTIGQPLGDGGGTRFAALFNSVGGGAFFEDDTMRNGNGDANAWSPDLGGANHWFKLERVNDTFISSVSSDGAQWTQVNSVNLPKIGSSIYAGAFIHAEQSLNPNLHWARLDNLTLTGSNVVGTAEVFVNPATNVVVAGLPATFAASVIGPAPTGYQWKFNGTNLVGATNRFLTIPAVQTANVGDYTVVADGVTSDPGVLLISVPAGSGVWTNVNGGLWPDVANWSGGAVAGGVDAVADFSRLSLNGNPGVLLNGARTVGTIVMDDTNPAAKHAWSIQTGSAGPLTLAASIGTPAIVVGGGGADIGAMVAGNQGFNKYGPGHLTLSGNGTFSGLVTVEAGTLEIQQKSGDAPYSVARDATLKIGYSTGGGYANTGITITGSGAASSAGLHLSGGINYNVAGGLIISGAPSVIRQYGTGLAGIGTFDINVNPGLSITADASGSSIDANIQIISLGYGMVVTTAAGARTASGDLTLDGPLNVGSLGLFKRGAGSLALKAPAATGNAAVNLQSGSILCGAAQCLGTKASVSLSSGTALSFGGFDQSVASLAIPAGATVDFAGVSTFVAKAAPTLGGALKMVIGKRVSTSASQLVAAAGTLHFGGTLAVQNVGPDPLAAGDSFTLFHAPAYGGAFNSLSLPPLPAGLGWKTDRLARDGSISIVANSVICYEPFGPTGGTQGRLPGLAPTGAGFAGSWTQSTADTGSASFILRTAAPGVFAQGWPINATLPLPDGGRAQLNDGAWSWTTLTRAISNPIRVQSAGVWYLSFLLHDNGNNNYSYQIFLGDSAKGQRIYLGHGYGGQLIAVGDSKTRPWQMTSTAGLVGGQIPGCNGNNQIFVVARIWSDGLGYATVQVKHYYFDPVARTGDPLEADPESVAWEATYTTPVEGSLDLLGLSGGCQNSLPEISEIRLATEWNDVTGAPPTPPRITQQPQSQIAPQGAAILFEVASTGSPRPTYRWKRGDAILTDGLTTNGSVVSGAATSVLTVQNAQTGDSGYYSAGITNAGGGIASALARLLISLPVGPGQEPVLTNLGFSGQLSFSFNATAGYRYLVQSSTNLGPSANWQTLTNIPPAFNDEWITISESITNLTTFFRAWVKDP